MAKNCTAANNNIPHTINEIPTIFVFFSLNATNIDPMFIAIIMTATINAPPKNRPNIGNPIKLLIKKYKKSPINGITRPRAAVIIVSF